MSDRTKACIDIDALYHNYAIVKKIAPQSRVLAMVKSNAYGHGIVAIGKILTQADGFGVACLDEAIKLRESGVTAPIVIMTGVFTPQDLQLVCQFDLQIVIHDASQIQLLDATPLESPIAVWLKIDTGMHRLGFAPEQFNSVYSKLANNPKVKQPIIIMTHLADADDIHKETTRLQVKRFTEQIRGFSNPKSIANSAGLLAWPETITDWNRPGIMLYGISPLLETTAGDYHLKPVMTLKSKIVAIHDFNKGDAIGYGGCWVCPENMRVGIVAIGYGDGYPRHAKNGTPVLIRNQRCQLIGRVSMDLIAVDLRQLSQVSVGEDVVLWGNDLPAEVVATYSDTIAYELVCNISQRVVLEYKQGNATCEF